MLKNKMPELSEHQIQNQILAYLRAKGWYCLRLNSGKYSVGEGKYKRFINGAEKGTPDLMCFKRFSKRIQGIPLELPLPELFFIEVKKPGKEPELAQVMKMNELEGYGAQCLVAHSVDEIEEAGL